MASKSVVVISVVVLVVIVLVVFRMTNNASAETGKYNEFAQCLTDNGVRMYGAWWCPHCQNQKKMFGDSWANINYVECSLPNKAQTQECTDLGIASYPTWEFGGGKRSQGELSFSALSSETGCVLPE
ncbi:hypothetical protein HY450_00305 [Candidatus Pacearchaeota archaeon]|nr:hypothetical protein [Candidatus Pacearchaeota archaeon]